MKKRLKLPNGYGSIVELSGNRRRPWAVRKAGKYIGYFESYAEATAFLADYNKQPLTPSSITFAECYRFEMAERSRKITQRTINGYRTAFNNCTAIHNKKLSELKVFDLQGIISDMAKRKIGQPSQKKVRQLFHNVYRYAVKYQLLPPTADISHYIDVDLLKRKYKKTPFNTRQLNRVKAIAESDSHLSFWAKCVVMLCYCGTRPSEFLAIVKSDVKLKQRYFIVRDSKTQAGRNRCVPINKKVLPYYEQFMLDTGKTLVSVDGNAITYSRFLRWFEKVMTKAKCKHKPHECRHTCATMLDDKGANKLSVKRILGHASKNITDSVYIHKNLRQLKKAIDLL